MPLNIRTAQTSDHAQWMELWQGYLIFSGASVSDAVSSKTWDRFSDESIPMHCVVAEVDGELVGMVHFIYHPSTLTLGDIAYLQDVFVQSAYRGQGIGRALIEYVVSSAAQNKVSRVWWLVHEHNHNAMQLYDHLAERSGLIQYRKLLH